jgi:trigger factor
MLEQVLAAEEWDEAAAEEIVRKSYVKALEDQKLEIDRTTPPNVVVNTLDKAGEKAEYTVKVPLPPQVEVGDYKSLPVEQPSAEVTDEDVEFEIDELRKRGQTREAVTDRGVEEGDVAVVNVKVEGEEADGRNFMTIAGQTFPKFDEALMGMHVEEMKKVELKFPTTFQEKDWAGKELKVQITLNSLSAVRLPMLDDSFAQSLKLENLDELRSRLREAIGRVKHQMVKQLVHEQLLKALSERSKVSVSDNMWENLAERRLRETAVEQAKQKKTLEQYATENGMTVEQLAQAWKDRAKTDVERALLIQAVYTKEGMRVGDRELNEELIAMAGEYNLEPLEMLSQLRQSEALDELHFRALSKMVGDYLLSNADVKIVEQPAAATK